MLLTSSRDSIAGAVTVPRPGQLGIRVFIPGPFKTILSAPSRPDRLWSRPNLLFNGTGGSFTGELSVHEAEHWTAFWCRSYDGVDLYLRGFWKDTCILAYTFDCLTLERCVCIGMFTSLCILVQQWPQSRSYSDHQIGNWNLKDCDM